MSESSKPPVTTKDPTRQQAIRYLQAAYGTAIWFKAPETIENLLERWIWAIASDAPDLAEKTMAEIEKMAASRDD